MKGDGSGTMCQKDNYTRKKLENRSDPRDPKTMRGKGCGGVQRGTKSGIKKMRGGRAL